MSKTLSAAEARRHLAEVLGKVTYASEEFIITRKGKPIARIVPYVAPVAGGLGSRAWFWRQELKQEGECPSNPTRGPEHALFQ